VTTLAGSAGVVGTTNGTGNAALFSGITALAVDGAGSLYVVEDGAQSIRKGTAPGYTGFPVITEQPESATVNKGGTVTLAAAAEGTPTLTYQWYLNGTAVAGATKATLKLTSVTTAKAGSYSVVVTNSLGSVTSSPAVVTVDVAPAITTQPVSLTVNQGATATLSVVATGTPSPTYQWYFGATAYPGGTSASLVQTVAAPWMTGSYKVVVMNSVGSVTSKTVTLTVDSAPLITTQPVSQTVVAGTNVVLTAAATGTPKPTYKWTLNGTAISGGTNGTLTLNAIKAASAGIYVATAANSLGSSASQPATITVLVPPTITTQPKSQSVKVGANVTFTAVAGGTAPLSYQWSYNGSPIAGATTSSLALTNVQTSSIGNYTVTVTNMAGAATSKAATLNVK
jgi:hypothetical protein